MPHEITKAFVDSLFDYEPESGVISWKDGIRRKKSKIVGCVEPRGYLLVRMNNKGYYLHRIAWVIANGEIPEGMQVDHINGDKSDNRISNLRLAFPHQNSHNARLFSTNSSGVKGVSWDKRESKWHARIYFRNSVYSVGHFYDIESARMSIESKRLELHGEFANHGNR